MKVNEQFLKRVIKEEIYRAVNNRNMMLKEEEEVDSDTSTPKPESDTSAESVFGSSNAGVRKGLIPFFMAACVVAAKLGPSGKYMDIEVHDDIRPEAYNYFLAKAKYEKLSKLRSFSSKEEYDNVKKDIKKALNTMNAQSKVPGFLDKAQEIYDRFIESGKEFLAFYGKIAVTDAGRGRIHDAKLFLYNKSGEATIGFLKSMGILMQDFLRWEKNDKKSISRSRVSNSDSEDLSSPEGQSKYEQTVSEVQEIIQDTYNKFVELFNSHQHLSLQDELGERDREDFRQEVRELMQEVEKTTGIKASYMSTYCQSNGNPTGAIDPESLIKGMVSQYRRFKAIESGKSRGLNITSMKK